MSLLRILDFWNNRVYGSECEIRKTDNYIDKKIPLDTVLIVADMLDHVLTKKKDKELLKDYVNDKLQKLNNIINADNGWPQIDKNLNKVRFVFILF